MDWGVVVNYLMQAIAALGLTILKALVVLTVGLKLIKWVKKWLRTSPKLEKIDPSLRTFLGSFASIGLYILLIVVMAGVVGVPATSFITILASCGVAIGLALQGSLSNFAGGLMLLLFKPFKVGDFIEACGETGTVTEITVVYTVLLTPDNKRITLPNGTLTNSTIENYSAEELRRVDLEFNTAYDCDIDQVKTLIGKLVEEHPMALAEPEPMVRLAVHGESALTYKVRVWCKNEDYWDLHFDLTESVKKVFDQNNIAIPYPQMDVHDKSDK